MKGLDLSLQNYTDVTIVLDRSGSMADIVSATIEGVNSFIADQRKVPGDGCWSLIQFDNLYETVYSAVPQDHVPLLTRETFRPRGGTALIDAACRAIDDTGARLRNTPEHLRPSKVLVVIMTDGEENCSQHFHKHHLAERITHQRDKYGWEFLFLGANQDAINTAAGYGIKSAFTYQANAIGTKRAFEKTSVATRSFKTDGNESADNLFIEPVRDVK